MNHNSKIYRMAPIIAFHYAVKHGGMKPGADALGISYPTMTQHIRTVEDRVGERLFEKVSGDRFHALTKHGEWFSKQIGPKIDDLERVLP